MDPLTVGCALAGLQTTAAKLASCLPEVAATTSLFQRLGRFISAPHGRAEVRLLVISLTACVLVFSELERVVDGRGLLNRVRRERVLGDAKARLAVLLRVAECESDGELRELRSVVNGLVESSRQLQAFMARQESPTETPRWRPFEAILHRTNVYRSRHVWRHSALSLAGSAVPATSWTVLLDSSLAEVPGLSLLSLPLYPADLYNASHYLAEAENGGAETAVTITAPPDGGDGWSDSENTAVDCRSTVTAPSEAPQISVPEEESGEEYGWGDHAAKEAVNILHGLVYDRKVISTAWTPVMGIDIQVPVPEDSERGGERVRIAVPFPPTEEADERSVINALNHYRMDNYVWEELSPIFTSIQRLQSLTTLIDNTDARLIEFVTTSIRYGLSRLQSITAIRHLSGHLRSLHDLLCALSITILYSPHRHLHHTALPTLQLQVLLLSTISNRLCSSTARSALSLSALRTSLVAEERLLMSSLYRLPNITVPQRFTDEEKVTFASHFEYFWEQLRERPWTRPELVWDAQESCYHGGEGAEAVGREIRKPVEGPRLEGWEWGKPWGRPQWEVMPEVREVLRRRLEFEREEWEERERERERDKRILREWWRTR